MDPAADRRRRRLLIAAIAGGLILLTLIVVGIYGLLRGPNLPDPAPTGNPAPSDSATPDATLTPEGPGVVSQLGGPEEFARNVATALFTWDTATGYGPADYAQPLTDVAATVEADALVGDVRGYLPTAEAWAQLRQYQTRQWLTIDQVFVPDAWATALEQAAPGQIPNGTTAYTIIGTRHRDGIWDTTPVDASRPTSFTVFITCTPPTPGLGGPGVCELLRLSALDSPLR